jgi:hypothetical protein
MGERLKPLALALTLTASLLLGAAAPTWPGDTQVEFVPEVNAYLRLSDRTRLFLLGSLTQGLTEAGTDGEVGIHLDVTLAPIVRRWLRDAVTTTFLAFLERYAKKMQAGGNILILAGMEPRVKEQLEATGTMALIGPERMSGHQTPRQQIKVDLRR